MQMVSPCPGFLSLGELVKKIETSATALKKRLRTVKKKMKLVTTQHRRIAKEKNLFAVAVTLTYRSSDDYSSKNISKFISCIRAKLKRKGHGLLYQWVLEQSESSLHHHLVLWLPRGIELDKTDLGRWWKWGSTWIESCRKVVAWVKYLSKRETKDGLPAGARVYGCGGLDEEGSEAVANGMLPLWLKSLLPSDAKPSRIPRVGWTDRNTGVVHISPWMWTPKGPRLKPVPTL
jgi:hypothetical protein